MTDDLGDIFHQLDSVFADAQATEAASWRHQADALGMAYDATIERRGSDGKAAFLDWATRKGIGKATRSKMLTVYRALTDEERSHGADLPATQQYDLARTVRDGKASLEDALADAYALSLSDFAEKYGYKKAPAPKAPTELVCPSCGAVHPESEYERSQA